jgi:hypothetical protein
MAGDLLEVFEIMRWLPRAALVLTLLLPFLLHPSALHAEPVIITSGGVSAQTWDEMGAHFSSPIQLGVLTTHSGLATLSFAPGSRVELSNHIQLSDVELVGLFNGPGAIDFRFTTGRAVQLPSTFAIDPGNPYYETYTQPFTFSGEVVGYDAARNVVFTRDLLGRGESDFLFHGVNASDGKRFFLTDTRFRFAPAAPVPEPATILMLLGGVATATARRRAMKR